MLNLKLMHADLYLKTITVTINCSYNCFCTRIHRLHSFSTQYKTEQFW